MQTNHKIFNLRLTNTFNKNISTNKQKEYLTLNRTKKSLKHFIVNCKNMFKHPWFIITKTYKHV